MVFEELNKKYSDDEYLNKYKCDECEKKVSIHLRVSPEIANDLTKIVATYREFGIDKRELTKSDLGSVIFLDFINKLNDDETELLNIYSKVKAIRDGCVVNG